MNTEFSYTEQGDLRIALTAQGWLFIQERRSLSAQTAQGTDTALFLELMDDQLLHGWYVIPTEQFRTQSRSVLLTRQVRYDELGRVTNLGDVYWCPRSELEPYVDTLRHTGSLLFKKRKQGRSQSVIDTNSENSGN
jgi:hypothetical protein